MGPFFSTLIRAQACGHQTAASDGTGRRWRERDECAGGQSLCDENAICTNTVHGHLCTCKPGYVGNGTICREPRVL
ncbi:hypothetical protein MHYP_G00220440 [Metynnis hypsauchen]